MWNQVIPFDLRTDVFLSMLERERVKHRSGHMGGPPGFQARIRRSHLYEDSISAFRRMRTGLKGRMQIEFINEMGLPEAGIDGGGLIKEFMNSLCKRAFDPQYALFAATQDDRLLYPSAVSHLAASDHLDHFVFLGRVLGKAMFESILVEPQFAG
jgi:ubiquitin-protein ligase E3 C